VGVNLVQRGLIGLIFGADDTARNVSTAYGGS